MNFYKMKNITMGLDVNVRKIRKSHMIENMTLEQMFNSGTYITEICKESGIEEWIRSMQFTELEHYNALAYRRLSNEARPIFTNKNWKSDLVNEMYNNFNENKFIYIARFDW